VVYDDGIAETALSSLREAGLVRLVHPSHGRSATRYRQVLDERFGLDARGLSIVAVLLLRGPQTLGELRTRTERMADFGSLGEVEHELARLGDGPDPFVRRLLRRPGHKEEQWAQLLTGEPVEPEATADSGAASADAAGERRAVSLRDEVAELRADVDSLRAEVLKIGAVVEELRVAFDL
jgi:hypothetical protein